MLSKVIKISGWTEEEPTKNYPQQSRYLDDNYDRVLEVIKDDIIKNKYCFGGDTHQYCPHCAPVISYDGDECLEWFGFRTWGKIMANAWNEIENTKKYCYMDFYMTNCIPDYLKYKTPDMQDKEIRFDGYVHTDTIFPPPTIIDMNKSNE